MTLAVIPARYASTRFPGKPLAPIAGKPLIQWVWERACAARLVDEVVIATDDERIAHRARAVGARVVMTSPNCLSGSDRVAEVASALSHEIVVNLQGDEPLLDPHAIDAVIAPMLADSTLNVTSLMRPIGSEEGANPNVVKVVVDSNFKALYFSRCAIPYHRDPPPCDPPLMRWGHIGIYCFRRSTLLQYARLVATPLERLENLEQLRILETGGAIRMVPTDYVAVGVDIPEDVARVEALLKHRESGAYPSAD